MKMVFASIFFSAGFVSCWNFMRSAYVYPALTPDIYLLDTAAAVVNFAFAWAACWVTARAAA